LVPARDHVALAVALRTMVGDVQMRVVMGTNGLSMAKTAFSSDLITELTLDVYRDLLSGSVQS